MNAARAGPKVTAAKFRRGGNVVKVAADRNRVAGADNNFVVEHRPAGPFRFMLLSDFDSNYVCPCF